MRMSPVFVLLLLWSGEGGCVRRAEEEDEEDRVYSEWMDGVYALHAVCMDGFTALRLFDNDSWLVLRFIRSD